MISANTVSGSPVLKKSKLATCSAPPVGPAEYLYGPKEPLDQALPVWVPDSWIMSYNKVAVSVVCCTTTKTSLLCESQNYPGSDHLPQEDIIKIRLKQEQGQKSVRAGAPGMCDLCPAYNRGPCSLGGKKRSQRNSHISSPFPFPHNKDSHFCHVWERALWPGYMLYIIIMPLANSQVALHVSGNILILHTQ